MPGKKKKGGGASISHRASEGGRGEKKRRGRIYLLGDYLCHPRKEKGKKKRHAAEGKLGGGRSKKEGWPPFII